MSPQIDGSKLLYAAGIAFVIAALVVFAQNLIFGLSVTVKTALLGVAAVSFAIAGATLTHNLLDSVAFALAAITYATAIGYAIVQYNIGTTGVFGLFALSGLLFVAVGYVLRDQHPSIRPRRAGIIILALLLVSAPLIGADVLTGGVTYTATFEDQVMLTDSDEPTVAADRYAHQMRPVGTMTITNNGPFTHQIAPPDVDGCLVGPNTTAVRPVLQYEPQRYEQQGVIGGGDQRQYTLQVQLAPRDNTTLPTTVAVERGTDCETDRSTPTLLVSVAEPSQDE